jgi:N-methylhydantoinase A
MSYRVGVDIGGTFTDFTVVDGGGEVLLWKEDSTPDEPVRAIADGLSAVAGTLGVEVERLLADTELFVHGTTIATNTLIQRNGPRVGLLCTKGFRDVLYFRDAFKPHRFDIHYPHPKGFVDRWLRLGVEGRLDRDGREITPLDEDGVRETARFLGEQGVDAVAVAFLWSMLDPAHELRAAEIVREELPDVHVVCSHAVLPEIREWERTSATVLSAYIVPGIAEYLGALEQRLEEGGLQRPPLIMQINGGCARVEEIVARPVSVLASGPAAAPAAALHYAGGRERGEGAGSANLITVDMGGTSLDVCVIRDGRPAMSRDVQVEEEPIGIQAVECHSIGAGGGSIAWIDDGGALRVGPRSAGAQPGPCAYGRGGTEPTVTDANVALGYLQPEAFLGGRRTLRDDLSRAAIEQRVAEPLGLSVLEAAAGIVRVVNANMVGAIRVMSVERGIDPRGFTLVCGGGAGGLHAVELARALGIEKVFVPAEAGTFCAFGMIVTEVRHDHASAFHVITDAADLDGLAATLAELERDARAQLTEEGFEDDQIGIEISVDARYPGQVHEITIPVAGSAPLGTDDLRQLERDFHAEHETQFAYRRDGLPVECLHWRVTATGRMPEPPSQSRSAEDHIAAPDGLAQAWSHRAGELVDMPTYLATGLLPGSRVEGPAIVQAATTTIVIGAGDVLATQADGNFAVTVDVSTA